MDNKKVESKFTIKFNKCDPLHLRVTEILNNQGRYGKAQYIVNAILHYENCEETPDLKSPARIDDKAIEAIVNRLLRNKDMRTRTPDKPKPKTNSTDSKEDSVLEHFDEISFDDAVETLGEDSINAIANAMAMFRGK